MQIATPGRRRRPGAVLFLLAVYALLLAGYVGLRYAGRSQDIDTIRLTAASQAVYAEQTASPAYDAYPYGYTYPTLNVFLAHVTGLALPALQTAVQPFLVALLVPLAYAAYRALTGQRAVAALAALLLFLSPEFLFEATRSSHAKVTWLLALTMLFILARSFGAAVSPRRLVVWVAPFYLATFGLISSSSFFASSYIFGLAFAFAATYLLLYLTWTRGAVAAQMRRLSYVAASCLVLVFLFIFYVYAPARTAFYTLQSTADKTAVFFLGVESETTSSAGANPYAYVQASWLNTWVYLALTAFNWLALLLSFVVWLRKSWWLLVLRAGLPPHGLLLWLLYPSFATLMVIALMVDRAGGLSANLQVRLFPHFLLVGIPLASEGIVAAWQWAHASRRVWRARLATVALVLLVSYFSLASLLKVTNEPLLSNHWTFQSSGEQYALQWVGDYVRNNRVWLGADRRLDALVTVLRDPARDSFQWSWELEPGSARYILASDIAAMRADRVGQTLPDTARLQRIYDAGDVELYYTRPQTPYQR